ncbi:MAG: endonuclease domain-containing protein [Minisyncoccia bacterium]
MDKIINNHKTPPDLPLSGEEVVVKYPPDKGDTGGLLKFIPYKKKLTSRAREFRKEMTKAEKNLWYKILNNKKKIGYKFTRQKPLGEFIADFYCAELLLVLEVDGIIHNLQKAKDIERTKYLNGKYNIKVVRYKNDEVLKNIENVYSDIIKQISKRVVEVRYPPDKGDTGGLYL